MKVMKNGQRSGFRASNDKVKRLARLHEKEFEGVLLNRADRRAKAKLTRQLLAS